MEKENNDWRKEIIPKERHDLINQKIDEIKELADDCILLAATEELKPIKMLS